ncbi:putative Ig domain-containing protein [Microcella sp.]|uniref:putative Ig domain-containing protein n=1 Tax=Microcella sp. TaxID=1913979 RepID=UPI002567B6F1|nr:putative Ig domain-containing protein [Microcella sp.]MBX9472054.1 putative Ig domain-containing protein [Microcella sp.]
MMSVRRKALTAGVAAGVAALVVVPVSIALAAPSSTIDVGDSPVGVVVSQDGQYAVVASSDGQRLDVVDLATRVVDRTVALPNRATDLVAHPEADRYLVASFTGSEVYDIDLSTDPASIATIDLLWAPDQVDVTPSGDRAVLANRATDEIAILDLDVGTVERYVDSGVDNPSPVIVIDDATAWAGAEGSAERVRIALATGATEIVATGIDDNSAFTLDPDGVHAWTAHGITGDLTQWRLSDGAVTETVLLASGQLTSVAANPVVPLLYVADFGGDVLVLDRSTASYLDPIDAAGPYRVAVSDDGATLLVVLLTGDVLLVFDLVVMAEPVAPLQGVEGEPFSFSTVVIDVDGMSASITDGALPQGLVLDPSTGVVSGEPEEFGTFSATITVTGSGDGQPRTLELDIEVEPADDVNPLPSASPSITPSPSPSGPAPDLGGDGAENDLAATGAAPVLPLLALGGMAVALGLVVTRLVRVRE